MTKNYKIKNLGCANCANKMERKIQKLKNIDSVSINFMTGKMLIESNENIDNNEIQKIVSSIESEAVIEEIL